MATAPDEEGVDPQNVANDDSPQLEKFIAMMRYFPCSFNLGLSNLDLTDHTFDGDGVRELLFSKGSWKGLISLWGINEDEEETDEEDDEEEEEDDSLEVLNKGMEDLTATDDEVVLGEGNLLTRAYAEVGRIPEARKLNDEIIKMTDSQDLVSLGNSAFLSFLENDLAAAYTVVKTLNELKQTTNFNDLKKKAILHQGLVFFWACGARNNLSAIEILTYLETCGSVNILVHLTLSTCYRRCSHVRTFNQEPVRIDRRKFTLEAAKRLFFVGELELFTRAARARALSELAFLKYTDSLPNARLLSIDEWNSILGEKDELELCKKAVELGKENPCYEVLGIAGQTCKYIDKNLAEAWLKESIEILPNSRAYHHLANLYRNIAFQDEQRNKKGQGRDQGRNWRRDHHQESEWRIGQGCEDSWRKSASRDPGHQGSSWRRTQNQRSDSQDWRSDLRDSQDQSSDWRDGQGRRSDWRGSQNERSNLRNSHDQRWSHRDGQAQRLDWGDSQDRRSSWRDSQDQSSDWRGSQGRRSSWRDSQDQSSDWRGSQGRRSSWRDSQAQSSDWRGSQGRRSDWRDSQDQKSYWRDSQDERSDLRNSQNERSTWRDSQDQRSDWRGGKDRRSHQMDSQYPRSGWRDSGESSNCGGWKDNVAKPLNIPASDQNFNSAAELLRIILTSGRKIRPIQAENESMQKSLQCYETMVRLNVSNINAQLDYGLALAQVGDYDKAIHVLLLILLTESLTFCFKDRISALQLIGKCFALRANKILRETGKVEIKLIDTAEEIILQSVSLAVAEVRAVPDLPTFAGELWKAFQNSQRTFRFTGTIDNQRKLFTLCEVIADYSRLPSLRRIIFSSNAEWSSDDVVQQRFHRELERNSLQSALLLLNLIPLRPEACKLSWQNSCAVREIQDMVKTVYVFGQGKIKDPIIDRIRRTLNIS